MPGTLLVLYVDDETSLLEIGKMFLERTGDFSVETIDSATTALELLKNKQFDAIISDYQMPGMDGIQFLIEVRRNYGSIPYILFTGKGREEVVIQAINSGADFYIQKGGNPEAQFTELAHKVRSAVSHHRAEKLAKDTERQLNDIINFLPDATFAIDIAGNVIAWNKAIEEMTGVPARDMLGKGNYEYSVPFYGERRPILIDLVFTPDEELTRGRYAIIKREGDILIAETTLPRPLGRYSVLLGKASLLYNDEDEVIGAIESIRDITEQKKGQEDLLKKNEELNSSFEELATSEEELRSHMEELAQQDQALRESEERFRALIQNSTDIIRIINADGFIVYDSPSSSHILGYPPGFTIGKRPLDFIHPDDQKLVQDALGEVYAHTNPGTPTEFRIRKADGSYIFVETIASNLIGVPGIQGIVTTTRSIEERKKSDNALKESEERFREQYQNNPIAILTWQQQEDDLYLVDFNKAAEKLTNGRVKNFLGISASNLYSSRPEVLAVVWQCISEKTTISKELISENFLPGRYIHATATFAPPDMIMVHIEDITEGKKSQEETKESEERLRSTLASIDDLVFTLDENDIFVGSYNPTVSNLYVLPEEFLGKSLREVLPKELADQLQKIIEEVKVTGKTQQVEYCLPVQGRIAWFNAKLSPRYSLDAIFTGVTCVARDITERKRAEEALRKSQSQLAEAMDLAHLVNWEYDVATGIFTFDDRFYALYGTTAELEGGIRMAADVYAKEFVHPDDQHMVANEVRKAIQAVDPGYVSEVEHRIIRRDGEIRHIVVRFGITKDEHGRTIKTHGANQDITDRKRAEEALNQANKKLNLLSGITRHDINNQLLVLNGFLNLLHKRTSDEALEDFFTKITKASSRISSMIRFTREYEEIGVKAPVWQDCRILVDNAAKEAPLGRVSLINDLTAGIEVYADPLITKVCYNLMDNAAKHGGKIKILRFSAMNRNGNHIIICEDDGEGIPDDEKEKIFVRGFGKNTGLGLFLSREILSITGITIRETGEPGKGARFEMTVPKGMYR